MDGKELVSGAAYDVYMDIKKRTNGEIYFGVVGPVRLVSQLLSKDLWNCVSFLL